MPLLGFVGLGVDTARGYMVRARLAQSLDSAALTAGRDSAAQAKAEEEAVHLLGHNGFTVSASSEVTRRTVYMDVVVSIDVSGSMDEYIGSAKKIDAARGAAHTLVDVLFGTSATKDLLKRASSPGTRMPASCRSDSSASATRRRPRASRRSRLPTPARTSARSGMRKIRRCRCCRGRPMAGPVASMRAFSTTSK